MYVYIENKIKIINLKKKNHHPGPYNNVEQHAYHLLFAFYLFRQEEELKCTVTRTYFAKLQVSAVLNIINRIKSVMEPYSDMVEQAL